MPFLGNGDSPPSVPVQVHVTAFLDRLLHVDDTAYEFEAVVWFYLSWIDGRVKEQIAANGRLLTAPNSTYECTLTCQSNQKAIAGGCCDGVWQPYIAFSNLKYLPQDRVVRYGLGWDPHGESVFQWRSVHATWFTPMDLRAFPFDRQHLLIQMEVPQVRAGWSGGLVTLVPSTTGTSLFSAKTAGDDVSGWGVDDVRLQPFVYPICQATLSGALRPSAPGDPSPVVPQYLWEDEATRRDAASCANALSSDPSRGRHSPFWRTPLTNASSIPEQPVEVSGLNCVIVVHRFTTRWVLSAIFPILATTWLGFLVFFLPRDDMNGRLGSIVALFLALAAIQFVVDADVPSSSYITPLQQLTLASYLSLIIVGIECVVIWWLTTYHVEKMRSTRHREAQQNYRAKLMTVRAALDAWLARAQADMSKRMSGGGSGSAGGAAARQQGPGLVRRASRTAKRALGRSLSLSASKGASRSAGDDDAAAAAGDADVGSTPERWGDSGDESGADKAAPGGEGQRAAPPRRRGKGTAVAEGAPASAADADAVGATAPLQQQRPQAVSVAPDSPEGEVRLTLSPRQAGGAAQPGAVQSAALQSAESADLLDAATEAALAAEAVASTTPGAGASTTGIQHRVGLLRFMRVSGSGASAGGATPPAAAQTFDHASAAAAAVAAAAMMDGGGGGAVGSATAPAPHTGALAPRSAGRPVDMAQVVHEAMAVRGRDIPASSLKGAGGGSGKGVPAAALLAGGDRGAERLLAGASRGWFRPGWWARTWGTFLDTVANDDVFADRLAHRCNKWCAVSQLVMYNVAAVLIFALNSALYRDRI